MNPSTRPRARTITVGADGSLASRRAVCWAVDHAQAGDTIVLVHAWRRTPNRSSEVVDVDDHAAAQQLIDHELCRARILASPKGVSVRGCAVEGNVDTVLSEADCDEIVIGRARRSPRTRLLTRSPATRILRKAHAPVTIVTLPRAG